MSDLIERQAAIDAFMNSVTPYGLMDDDGNIVSGCKDKDVIAMLYNLPSAQPDLLDDGTLMITVPNGMLNDVKRVLVDEVGTKFCKTMYQDEPERKKGRWIDQDDGAYYPVECSECRKIPLFDVDGDYVLSNYCPNCGAEMRPTERNSHV